MKHAALLVTGMVVGVAASALAGPGHGLTSARASVPASQVSVRGWGTTADGALGAGSGGFSGLKPVKVKIPAGLKVTSVRAGCDHSVALTSTGGVLAWGNNTFGEVGDGTFKNPRNTPVRVKLPKGVTIIAVRAGCESNLALTKSGSVLAWGQGALAALGDGGVKNQNVPVPVKLPKNLKVKAISAGCEDGFALTSSGRLYAWGANGKGQLGDGTHQNRRNPVLVKLPAGAKATMVSAGCKHTMAVTNEGLLGWGDNQQGQLGDGDMKSTDLPTAVPLLFRGTGPGQLTSIFAGCEQTIALFSKGVVLAWGSNSIGQLGTDTVSGSDKPVSVALPDGLIIKTISAGCDNGYALSTTGTLYAWGDGMEGELGDGGSSESNLPVPVSIPAGLKVTALGSGPGAHHAFAITVAGAS